jgi:hypothetical protein
LRAAAGSGRHQNIATDPEVVTSGLYEGGEGVDDTAGPVMGTDTDDELPNGCLPDAVPGYFGYVHQCAGEILAQSTASGIPGADLVQFGNSVEGESYAEPKVMACCDPLEPEGSSEPHLWNCYLDLVETLSRSLPIRIVDAVKSSGPAVKNQATKLANYIADADGQNLCKEAFLADSEFAAWEIDDLQAPLQHTWVLANDPGYAAEASEWPLIEDPEIYIDATVDGIFLPPNPVDWIECVDQGKSDSQSFLVPSEDSPDYAFTINLGDAVLVGLTTQDGTFTANPELSAQDNDCSGLGCSSISFSEDAGTWTVHSLVLHSAGPTEVSNRTTSFTADFFRVELVGPVTATSLGPNKFAIPMLVHTFVLSGSLEGVPHILSGTNLTDIVVENRAGVWGTNSFALRYVDSDAQPWDLTIGAASWD